MKKQTEGEFNFRLGRMVKGVNPLLLEDEQTSDTQNMQPTTQGWKQRKGQSELTTSAIASGLKFKSLLHFRDLKGNTNTIMAHVYDAVNGERIMRQDTLPASTHLGNTWEALYTCTASCENTQFALVAGALIAANNKEFLVWRGDKHLPSGVWKFVDTTDRYVDYWDEMVDGNASTTMSLSSMTIGDYVYITSPMPMDKLVVDVGNTNSTAGWMMFEYWNGVWTILKTASWWSNTTHLDDDCDTLTGWDDDDAGGGASTQTAFYGKETFKLLSGDAGGGNDAGISKDVGSFGSTISISALCYHDTLGANGDDDHFMIRMQLTGGRLSVRLATDGVFVYDGASNNQAGTAVAETDRWILWTVVADFSTPASATCSIYKNGTTVATGVDCSDTTAGTDGDVIFKQYGTGTANQLTYISQVVVGSALDTTGDAFVDGTSSSATTLAQDGNITWTAPGDEEKTLIEATPGYAVRFAPSITLDGSVTLLGLDIRTPMDTVKSLWSQEYMNATGLYVYDGTDYSDYVIMVGNTVTSQYADLTGLTTTYKLYIGFPHRTNRIFLHVVPGNTNTNNVSISTVKYMAAGGDFTSVGTFTDTTETGAGPSTLSQKGYISWTDPGRYTEKMCVVGGDTQPWYWYEIVVDAAVSDDTYLYYVEAIPIPDDPDYSYGCFGWKRRGWQIAPLNRENQVRYSAENLLDVWFGGDSGYIEFGERPLRCAAPFYNETLLWADTEMWMLQGNSPQNFGRLRLSANIGCAAPQSPVSIEAGVAVGDSLKNVVVWFFYDGIWMFDGVRIFKISSPDIDTFFDPDHADYINPTYMNKTYGAYDHDTQCAMWSVYSGSSATTPTKVLVVHFPSMWYGIYDYGTDIGPICRVFNNRWYTVAGGNADGKLYLLNSGVTDYVAGVATAVDTYVITRDMFAGYSDGLRQRLLSIWVESQEDGGLVEVYEYPDGSDTPQEVTKHHMRWLGKLFGMFQKTLKVWPNQKTTKFKIRNRSKNARMNLLGFSTTVDKGRADE